MFVVFVGPPGVGKGTQAALLREHLQIGHLSTGEVLRQLIFDDTPLGKTAKAFIDIGKLVPDHVMIDLVDDRLENQEGCLLDGFPRTITQAKALDVILAKGEKEVSIVIRLTADRAELIRRLSMRACEGRSDDSDLETIRRRLEIFDSRTAPLIEFYRRQGKLAEVDGIGTPPEVFARVLAAMSSEDGCC